MMTTQDQLNKATWQQPGAMHWLSSLQGFTDAGESAAFWAIFDEMRDQPILDLGVGCGRTIIFLRSLSSNYRAIDYITDMVDRTRSQFPFVDVSEGDARDLSRYPDLSFALVVFSHAGLDALDRMGRLTALKETHRVLKSGGVFWFSTLNKDGTEPRRRPWQLNPHPIKKNIIVYAGEMLQELIGIPRNLVNYHRLKKSGKNEEDWMIAPCSAHDYGLLTHYIELSRQIRDLREAGYSGRIQVFDPLGHEIESFEKPVNCDFFNIIARK